MISNKLMSTLKMLKVKNVFTVNPFFIIGDNDDDCILKTLSINSDIGVDILNYGIDINAYNKSIKDDTVNNTILWNNKNISDKLINKLNSVNNLKFNSTECISKDLSREYDSDFYRLLSAPSNSCGEFIDIFNDGKHLLVFPALFKIKKDEVLSVNRYTIENNKLYEFTLKNKTYSINTYILTIDI